MATEAQRAPRVARDSTSMADAAASLQSRHAAAVATLAGFSINETSPFRDEAHELARDCLDEAHALTIIFDNVLSETPDEKSTIYDHHLGKAISAIGRLIALGCFAIEAQS